MQTRLLQLSPGRSTAVDAGATAESSEVRTVRHVSSLISGIGITSRQLYTATAALAANPSSRTVQVVYTDAWHSESSVSGVLV